MSNRRIEFLVDGHEKEAHEVLHNQHAILSGRIYTDMELQDFGNMDEEQKATFLLAHKTEYHQIGTLERLMENLREINDKKEGRTRTRPHIEE